MTEVTETDAGLAKPRVWPVSVKAYHVLGELGLIPERTELLYGQVFQKMPKSPFHCLLLMRLLEMLRSVALVGRHVRPEQPLVCGDSEPEPDLAVVQGSLENYGTAHPRTADLVIEICVTTEEYDRSKLRAYAEAGVKEVWLILAPEKRIETHRRPTAGSYSERAVFGSGERVTCTAVPELVLEMDRLFLAVSTKV